MTALLVDQSVEEFTRKLAAGTPTPGGGSAAALAGGLAAALVQMVCDLTIGKEAYRVHEQDLRAIRERASQLCQTLVSLVDKDALAYDGVMEALRRPKGSDAEKAARREAIGRANLAATEIPLRTAEACAAVLELGADLAPKGNRNASSDVGTSCVLAHAALVAALMNVRTNLSGLADPSQSASMAQQADLLESEGTKRRDRCLALVAAAQAQR
jgi:methenyltetrahydrofolate cyclohydrolase